MWTFPQHQNSIQIARRGDDSDQLCVHDVQRSSIVDRECGVSSPVMCLSTNSVPDPNLI